MTLQEKRFKIRQINDNFRGTFDRCNITRGIAELGPFIEEIAEKIRTYSNFSQEDEPFDDHDFGSFTIFDHLMFWKIDYYDPTMSKWCNPLSPDCRRVMTIMLAEEY